MSVTNLKPRALKVTSIGDHVFLSFLASRCVESRFLRRFRTHPSLMLAFSLMGCNEDDALAASALGIHSSNWHAWITMPCHLS